MTAMINHAPRWSHARGNTVVPSRWQATINIPTRLAFSAGSFTLHLPANSRRERPFMTMFDDIQAPPQAA